MNADFAKGNEAALLRYWHGRMGGGQGRPGDYDECVAALSKHPKIGDPHGLCQWLHIQATGHPAGHAPAEDAGKAKHAMKLSTERDGITLFANWDSQAKRDAAPTETFCGPHKSFPISDCEDVTHARMLEHHNPSVGACVERKAKSLSCPEPGAKTEHAMEVQDDGTRFSFDASLTPAGVTTPEGMVIRRGKIFEVGDYPDKGFALSPEEAVIEVERFQPVPLNAGHPNAPSQLDGKMGRLQSISYSDDGALSGEVHIAPWLNELLGSDPLTVSTEWSKGKRISALSLVTNPRVTDAALMAAFARNDVAGSQRRWQKIHDQSCKGGAGCGAVQMAAAKLSDIQQVHNIAAAQGPYCYGDGLMSGGASKGLAWAPQAAAKAIHGNGRGAGFAKGVKNMGFKKFWKRPEVQAAAQAEGVDPATFSADSPLPDPRVTELERKLAETEKRFSDEREQRTKDAAAAFADLMVEQSRIMPADKDRLVKRYLRAAEDDERLPVRFAAGEKSRVVELREEEETRPKHWLGDDLLPSDADPKKVAEFMTNVMKTEGARISVTGKKEVPAVTFASAEDFRKSDEYKRIMAGTPLGQSVLDAQHQIASKN